MYVKLLLTFAFYVGMLQGLVNCLLLRPPYYFSKTAERQPHGKQNDMTEFESTGTADSVKTKGDEFMGDYAWFRTKRTRGDMSRILKHHFNTKLMKRKLIRKPLVLLEVTSNTKTT